MSLKEANTTSWQELQLKVFARWTTNALKSRNIVVNDITTELTDGISLVNLAEVLTTKPAYRKYDHKPRLAIQKVQNCDLAIDMFIKDNVKLIGIGGKDIVDGKVTLTLGLIWTLIMKYSIAVLNQNDDKPNQSATAALLQWCIDQTKTYDGVEEFKPLGLALCALLNNYRPDLTRFPELDQSDATNSAKVAVNACNEMNIPVLVDVEDIVNGMDDKTLFTQLSLIKKELDGMEPWSGEVQERSVEIEVVPDNDLLQWFIDQTQDYDGVQEFKPFPTGLCAVINNYRPDLIHYKDLDKNDKQNEASVGLDAMKTLDIPVLVEQDNVVNEVEDQPYWDQLAELKKALENLPRFDMQWFINHTKDYDGVQDFKPLPKAMAALINCYRPDLIKYNSNKVGEQTPEEQAKLVVDAEKELNIPVLLQTGEVVAAVENKSYYDQLTELRNRLERLEKVEEPPYDIEKWAIDQTNEYEGVEDLRPLPQALAALINNYRPDLIKYNSEKVSEKAPMEQANKVVQAENALNIPVILEPEQIVKGDKNKPYYNQLVELKKHLEPLERVEEPPYDIEKWAIDQTNEYEGVEDLRPLPQALAALINNYRPDLIHYKADDLANSNPDDVAQLVVEAERALDIPVILQQNDIVKGDKSKPYYDQLVELKKHLEPLEKVEEIVDEDPIIKSGKPVDGDNEELEGKTIILTLDVKNFDPETNGYIEHPNEEHNNERLSVCNENDGVSFNVNIINARKGPKGTKTMAISLTGTHFLNEAGMKLDLAEPNPNDKFQRFTVGKGEKNTIIYSNYHNYLVWDVADGNTWNPPHGTPLYTFPVHEKHNQHFVYKHHHIYAKQNGQCVTFVGGQCPLVMMQQTRELKDRQTFHVTIV